MSKQRTHYMRVKVVFDRPIGQNMATDIFKSSFQGETLGLSILDAERAGAESLKITSIVREVSKK